MKEQVLLWKIWYLDLKIWWNLLSALKNSERNLRFWTSKGSLWKIPEECPPSDLEPLFFPAHSALEVGFKPLPQGLSGPVLPLSDHLTEGSEDSVYISFISHLTQAPWGQGHLLLCISLLLVPGMLFGTWQAFSKHLLHLIILFRAGIELERRGMERSSWLRHLTPSCLHRGPHWKSVLFADQRGRHQWNVKSATDLNKHIILSCLFEGLSIGCLYGLCLIIFPSPW